MSIGVRSGKVKKYEISKMSATEYVRWTTQTERCASFVTKMSKMGSLRNRDIFIVSGDVLHVI